MQHIGIFCKPDKERAPRILFEFLDWIKAKNLTPFLEQSTSELISFPPSFQQTGKVLSLEEMAAKIDLLVILGGDGTLLRAAHLIGDKGTPPILGVNLGSLGFLTEIATFELIPVLEFILQNGYSVDERMMLTAIFIEEDGSEGIFSALNDIVFAKGSESHLIALSINADSTWINTFLADGLIVATPTGSTAYSLSAGGPIIHPAMQAILITPICPHTLTNRPIVMPDIQTIEVRSKSKDDILLSIDGRFIKKIGYEEAVCIKKAKSKIRLIKHPNKDYYQVLRTKLQWGKR